MGKREEKIEYIIRHKVFKGCFGTGNFKKGKSILHKFYLQYYGRLDNFETNRMIIYNLIVAECMDEDKDEDFVCKLVLQLKNDMDKEDNYKENHTGKYLDMMSYYTGREGIKLSKEELIEYYDFSYNYWKNRYEAEGNLEHYMWMQIARFDKEKELNNYHNILEIIKDIHNVNNEQKISTEKRMLIEIEKLDEHLYEDAVKIVNTVKLITCI